MLSEDYKFRKSHEKNCFLNIPQLITILCLKFSYSERSTQCQIWGCKLKDVFKNPCFQTSNFKQKRDTLTHSESWHHVKSWMVWVSFFFNDLKDLLVHFMAYNLKSKGRIEIVKFPLFQLSQCDNSYGKVDLQWQERKQIYMHGWTVDRALLVWGGGEGSKNHT